MRTIAFGLALLVSFTHAVFAQGAPAVVGHVVDQSGHAISDALIELRPGSRRTVSDNDGRFEFANVTAGKYTVAVHRIGYQPANAMVDVTDAGAKPTITLVAIPRVLDSIRITERANNMRYAAIVVDDAGAPIPDVAVVLEGVVNNIRTDSAGHFVVPRNVHGALMLRMRKIGFVPYFGSFEMVASRQDTLRMSRLAQGLSAVQITEESGFGRDTFVYKDLDERMRWRNHLSLLVTGDDLARHGRENLCRVVGCRNADCIILDGTRRTLMPVTAYYADEVSSIEVYPPGSDWSGNLASRGCYSVTGRTIVIWMRKDHAAKP
ncbi:MAG: carboxypeptidase regulatory-like domain-containing protein [Gemmatimonadaceae bacterium]